MLKNGDITSYFARYVNGPSTSGVNDQYYLTPTAYIQPLNSFRIIRDKSKKDMITFQ